ncbi:hypothetical protein [uncultured Pseudokineococcus sp.]|uniref:hypothetical protein n=1 Tax=uncultured Pseudokineococcus sp. TaxID=1642928 RepID=UPI00262C405A|nr:hypothetical protein [uncultured Pseudokineococcus sp.]
MPTEPVASVPGQDPGMILEVYRVARSGATTTLTMAVLNDGVEDFNIGGSFTASSGRPPVTFDTSGISLLDPVGLDRYTVFIDTEDQCLCSELERQTLVEPGQRVHLSASFPAPPASVTSVTVETPVGSLAGVPITDLS